MLDAKGLCTRGFVPGALYQGLCTRGFVMDGSSFIFHDLAPGEDSFRDAVLGGLSTTPKSLPCKFFYDQRRAALVIEELARQRFGRCREAAQHRVAEAVLARREVVEDEARSVHYKAPGTKPLVQSPWYKAPGTKPLGIKHPPRDASRRTPSAPKAERNCGRSRGCARPGSPPRRRATPSGST